MQRPPEGLHIHVYGADAEALHINLQKNVCKMCSLFPHCFRLYLRENSERVLQNEE
jgi:hypothetical protein